MEQLHPEVSDYLNRVREMELTFFEAVIEEGARDSEDLRAWEKNAFHEDGWIFNQSSDTPESALERAYDNMETGIRFWRHLPSLSWNLVVIFTAPKFPWMIPHMRKLMVASKRRQLIQRKDGWYNWMVNQALEGIQQEQSCLELSEQETVSARLNGSPDEPTFFNKRRMRMEFQKGGQLNRIIAEDCQNSGGIKVLQPVGKGDCSIASHLRIEKLSKYMGISLVDADYLAWIYNALGLTGSEGYKAVSRRPIRKRVDKNGRIAKNKLPLPPKNYDTLSFLNEQIAKRKTSRNDSKRTSLNTYLARKMRATGLKPWHVVVGKGGTTLEDMALAMDKLHKEAQQDPEWSHYDDGIFSFDIVDDMATMTPESELSASRFMADEGFGWMEEPEDPFEITNTVGHADGFTYWHNTVITGPDHLTSKHTMPVFKALDAYLDGKRAKGQSIPELNKAIKAVERKLHRHIKRLSPAQKQHIHTKIANLCRPAA